MEKCEILHKFYDIISDLSRKDVNLKLEKSRADIAAFVFSIE